MITLQEYNGLDERLINDLKELIAACKATDGYEPMLYWDVLKLRRKIPGDYCLYQNNNMIGYLSTFNFEDDCIEISFAIHPDFRNQSLFEELLGYARDQLQFMHYDALLLSTGEQDTILMNTFTRLGAKKTHEEYILTRNDLGAEEIYADDPIELVPAQKKKDAPLLADIHARCFNSDLEFMLERFTKTLAMPNRRCFLAFHHGEAIGAVHVRIDSNRSICLHDISIVPEKQHFGFGLQLLRLVLNTLIADGQTQFNMIVAAENQRALRLYHRCHFEVEQAYQFWRIDKHFTFPPHYTLPKRKH